MYITLLFHVTCFWWKVAEDSWQLQVIYCDEPAEIEEACDTQESCRPKERGRKMFFLAWEFSRKFFLCKGRSFKRELCWFPIEFVVPVKSL